MFIFKSLALPYIKNLYLILSIACLCQPSDGFTLERNTRTRSTELSVGNFISGLTNSPPSKPLLSTELEGQLISGTSLQDKELKCVYKASEDGWSANDFHRCVDDKGSGLVVALTRSGQVLGGFNPLGWRSTDDYYGSNAAFLWFAKGKKAVKAPILPGGKFDERYELGRFICNDSKHFLTLFFGTQVMRPSLTMRLRGPVLVLLT